jgi:hypothetical protein
MAVQASGIIASNIYQAGKFMLPFLALSFVRH